MLEKDIGKCFKAILKNLIGNIYLKKEKDMFIYSVTHIPTKRFYIGYHKGPIKNIELDQDPMKMFTDQIKGYNDAYVMYNVVKELLIKVGNDAEAMDHLSKLAKHYESNPQFLGIQLDKEKEKVEDKPVNVQKQPADISKKSIDKV